MLFVLLFKFLTGIWSQRTSYWMIVVRSISFSRSSYLWTPAWPVWAFYVGMLHCFTDIYSSRHFGCKPPVFWCCSTILQVSCPENGQQSMSSSEQLSAFIYSLFFFCFWTHLFCPHRPHCLSLHQLCYCRYRSLSNESLDWLECSALWLISPLFLLVQVTFGFQTSALLFRSLKERRYEGEWAL